MDVFIIKLDAYQKATLKVRKHPNRGVSSKLCDKDKILLMLMYYREYLTMFNIGASHRVSEATVCKTINDVKDKLIKNDPFHLKGKKALLEESSANDIILIDISKRSLMRSISFKV